MVDGAKFGAELRGLAGLAGDFLAWQTWRAGKGWIGKGQLVPGGGSWSVRLCQEETGWRRFFFKANFHAVNVDSQRYSLSIIVQVS